MTNSTNCRGRGFIKKPMKPIKTILTHLERPRTWVAMWVIWWLATFAASSFSIHSPAPPGLQIPHLDKVMHFCWFAGGGFLLATAIRLRRPPVTSVLVRLVLPILAMSLLGALDEFRQSFTPDRNGNDPGDWLADTLGGTFGVILANSLHRYLSARRFPHARH